MGLSDACVGVILSVCFKVSSILYLGLNNTIIHGTFSMLR